LSPNSNTRALEKTLEETSRASLLIHARIEQNRTQQKKKQVRERERERGQLY
jgi:hypothetical protein